PAWPAPGRSSWRASSVIDGDRRGRVVSPASAPGWPGMSRPAGPGLRLGPHHIQIARVVGQILRPAAVTPDPRRAGTDALHRQTRRRLRRPGTYRAGRLRRPSRAGPGAANTSPTTPHAQRMRTAAVSG